MPKDYMPGTKRGEDRQGRKIMQHSSAENKRIWAKNKKKIADKPFRATPIPTKVRSGRRTNTKPWPYPGRYGGDTTRSA